MDNFSPEERKSLKEPKYFYEVTFDKPGGLVMPLIVQYEYEDGSKETIKYPVQVWRKNDSEVRKVIASDKEIKKIIVDPNLETADIDTSNNSWPKRKGLSKFNKKKDQLKD
ncbi:MAG: M1 family peptidase, partial [Flavobacteriaceae bacterium]|nr:M1 family peptidase [Flavobacteriaceae bacterium]